MVYYPRVLVIGNNSFSKTNSNGRTLGSLFQGWPKDKLAQFYISSDNLDFEVCYNYFNVTDKEALFSLFHVREKKSESTNLGGAKTLRKSRRTVFQTIAREIVWRSGMWKSKQLGAWLNSFSPEIVVIQSGDFPYLINFAKQIAKRFSAKFVFYNTEGYYFFENNYMDKGSLDVILFPLFQKYYRNIFQKAMNYASYAIYLNDLLKEDYDASFTVPSSVIYNSSDIVASNHEFNSKSPQITYLGNLVMGRDDALIKFAEVLSSISGDLALNVYGNADEKTKEKFERVSSLNYCGVVTYDEVRRITKESDVLVHAESQDISVKESLKYGFSGKIADCLLSGHPFVVFASRDYACSQYLENNRIGWVASTEDELKSVLNEILYKEDIRSSVVERSFQVASQNHDLLKNKQKFQEILKSL